MAGLGWLAKVGPAPLDAWRYAMGWSEVAARSHARRLETAGWLARYPMTRGAGSLFVATRTGIRVIGLPLRPTGPPAPIWWAHHSGCAWVATYLHLRGREFLGAREVLDDDAWSGMVRWNDSKGSHRAGHRPDLVGAVPNGIAVAVELELAHKSMARLQAIIRLHATWKAEGRTGGVLYICGDADCASRIQEASKHVVGPDWLGLRIRLLAELQQQAVQMSDQRRTERGQPASGRETKTKHST